MLVKPLKYAAGKYNFGPNSPAFEVSDAEAKVLIADGAVESLEPEEKPKPQDEPKQRRQRPRSEA